MHALSTDPGPDVEGYPAIGPLIVEAGPQLGPDPGPRFEANMPPSPAEASTSSGSSPLTLKLQDTALRKQTQKRNRVTHHVSLSQADLRVISLGLPARISLSEVKKSARRKACT